MGEVSFQIRVRKLRDRRLDALGFRIRFLITHNLIL